MILEKSYNGELVVNIQFYKDGELVQNISVVGCHSGFCEQLRCVVEARAEAALASSSINDAAAAKGFPQNLI